jgi:FlaA1/EpsC-like NDP-sugar epimerase
VPELVFRAADLLGRPEIAVDLAPFDEAIRGRTALVTGAAGSIGSEIARRLAQSEVAALVLLDRAETELDRLEEALRRSARPRLLTTLADVRDRVAIDRLFAVHRPHFVFHSAGYKHVPLLETHPAAAVSNNVGGTLTVAAAARAAGADRFVNISTDKAIRPTSVMGASKRAAEIALHRLAAAGGPTTFVTVRFGNVLDSRGNVVERFRRQLERG